MVLREQTHVHEGTGGAEANRSPHRAISRQGVIHGAHRHGASRFRFSGVFVYCVTDPVSSLIDTAVSMLAAVMVSRLA